MKPLFLLLIVVFTTIRPLRAQTPVLGTYPTTTITTAGSNAIITPATAPTNTTSITASTSANFKGLLHVNPVTGIVTITNAYPAGSYTITVKAFKGSLSQTVSFQLAVNNTNCSQGNFTGPGNVTNSGNGVNKLVVADFNNDGKQDIVSIYSSSTSMNVFLGNGAGGFTPSFNYQLGVTAQSVAVGDFNGDGKQDLAIAIYNTVAILVGNGSGQFTTLTNVSAGTVPTSITTGEFNGDGRQDLAYVNSFSNKIYIRLGDGNGNFTGTTEVTVGSNPYDVVVGDFNNDGKTDLATANFRDSTVSIRLGTGSGVFMGTSTVAVNGTPSTIELGDFNGDGIVDFATANTSNNKVSIRIGDGTGGFSGSVLLTVARSLTSVIIGDFNGEGRQDLAATSRDELSGLTNTIAVWLNNGTGGFTAISNVVLSFSPYKAVVGDFNADGLQDLAIGGGATVPSVCLGNINEIDVRGNNISIIDGDTTPDISDNTAFDTTYNNLKHFYTIRNIGNVPLIINDISTAGADSAFFIRSDIALPNTIAAGGSTTFSVTFSPKLAGTRTTMVNISNNDCDEALYNFTVRGTAPPSPVLGIYPSATIRKTGGNTKVTPSVAPTFAAPLSASASANFKGVLHVNPITGVVTVTNAHPAGTYTIFVGTVASTTSFTLVVNNASCGDGTFSGTTTFSVGAGPRAIALGDFNNDGKQDLAVPNSNSNHVSIVLGDGAGHFTAMNNLSVSRPFAIAVADFNSDGNQDLAITNYDSSTVYVRFGDGLGNFSGTAKVYAGIAPYSIVTADFNSDGKPDIAIAGASTLGLVSVLLNNGLGDFYGLSTVTVGSSPISIVAGDFNNDGKADFATANNSSTSSNVSICIGNGNGGFAVTSNVIAGSQPTSLAVADFNNDGKQDLIISNQSSANVSIRLGDGAGGFTGTTNIPFALSGFNLPLAVETGDFNGDGNQDFLLTINGSNMIAVRLGDGAGGFSTAPTVIVESNPRSLVVGDFNGDGKQDIAAANAGSNNVSIRLGNGAEINVQGNHMDITSGSNLPDTVNSTYFGSIATGGNSARTFTIFNNGTDTLRLSNIVLTGPDSLLFTTSGLILPAIVIPGTSQSFTITFSPADGGLKNAGVSILNDDCDETNYHFLIAGKATCSTLSASNTWLGITSDWNAPTNWSLGFVPDGCGIAVVNTGVPSMPQISTNASCYSLTLNSGATVNVTGAGRLTITGP